MIRYLLLIGIALFLALPARPLFAIETVDAVITTAVVNREPVDKVKVFPVMNGKLFCFTRIIGAAEPTEVYHVWFRGQQLMSRVRLPVNSPDWRTWSAKTFLDDWAGDWRVEIQDVDGKLLREVTFELR